MALFRRKPEPVAEPVAEEPAPVVDPGPQPGDRFDGPHIFSEGFFYPLAFDENGVELGPDRSKPLVRVGDPGDGRLEYAYPDSPNHFHSYGVNPVEIVPDPEHM